MDSSYIFTESEHEALKERLKGNKKDPTGIYANRVKPKLWEILFWSTRKDEIKEILTEKLRSNEETEEDE